MVVPLPPPPDKKTFEFKTPKPVLNIPDDDDDDDDEEGEKTTETFFAPPPPAPAPRPVGSKPDPPGFWWSDEPSATLRRETPAPAGARRFLALHGADSNNRAASVEATNVGVATHDVVYLRGPLPSHYGFCWWTDGNSIELEAALKGVAAFIDTHGPFFGIIGFGQGAALAASLSARGVAVDFGAKRTWECCVLAGATDEAFPAVDSLIRKLRDQPTGLSVFLNRWIELPVRPPESKPKVRSPTDYPRGAPRRGRDPPSGDRTASPCVCPEARRPRRRPFRSGVVLSTDVATPAPTRVVSSQVLTIVGMGDADRRDASLRVSRCFKWTTNVVHQGGAVVPADARDDRGFRDVVDGFVRQPYLC